MILTGLIILGLLIAGSLLGWLAFFRVAKLEQQLAQLRQQLQQVEVENPRQSAAENPPMDVPVFDLELPPGPIPTAPLPATPAPLPPPDQAASLAATPDEGSQKRAEKWQGQWMIWLGGLCVALAGIFMVRYSIEQGLLGPAGRVALGLASGILLHLGAEWLLRKRGAHPSFAAMAGGASITLYAALLAALQLYHLMDARLVFALLAGVSLATMLLSLRQGPALAAIGLLGGYLVPVLVSTGSDNVIAALLYALIISVSGLLLTRYVFRPWLWWGIVAGVLGWWGIAVAGNRAEDFQGIYLAIAAYALLAVPGFDWLLSHRVETEPPSPDSTVIRGQRYLRPALCLLAAAWAVSLYLAADQSLRIVQWAPLVLVIGFAARNNTRLTVFSWLTLLLGCLAIGGAQLQHLPGYGWQLQTLAPAAAKGVLAYALQMAAIYVWLATIGLRHRTFSHRQCALLCLSPLSWLALAYLLTGDLSGSWQWGLIAVIMGLIYIAIAGYRLERAPADEANLWLVLASHSAYSLAAAMYFREAGLTLALAAQLITLAWLVRRYHYPWLDWLMKGAVAIVVARLSFNPWLLTYPADIHWSLWTCGGSTLFCAIAAWLVGRSHPLRRWLEAAGLHLLVLTLGAEVRYWLYDGDIFRHRYSLTESAINSCLWAGLGLTYYLRAGTSQQLSALYRLMSTILLAMAGASYLASITLLNPLWSAEQVSSRPVFNLLLLAYGLPVALAAAINQMYTQPVRKLAGILSAFGAFLFISLEIRHLWQGQLSLDLPTGNGELYTYSAVWLGIAILAVLAGTLKGRATFNRYGFALLALVIGKIFLVDLSDLEGLLRVASFMGLGLSLLGLAYLRSRLSGRTSTA